MQISPERLFTEKLKFGREPQRFTQALSRLPINDPIILKDREMITLAILRLRIQAALWTNESKKILPNLEDRLVDLNSNEMKLLRQDCHSFRNTEILYQFDWSRVSKQWRSVYDEKKVDYDDTFKKWNIHYISPNIHPDEDLQLICIETNSDYPRRDNPEYSKYKIGLITISELTDLMVELSEHSV